MRRRVSRFLLAVALVAFRAGAQCTSAPVTVPPNIATSNAVRIMFDGKTGDPPADPALVCNDGTPAGFYVDMTPCTGPTKQCSQWMIHMEGGGDCHDDFGCYDRAINDPSSSATTWSLLSSDKWFPTMQLGGDREGGFMTPDQRISPFWNYNKVVIPYCSSDVFSGDNPGTLNPAVSNIHDPNIYEPCTKTNPATCSPTEPRAPHTMWHFRGKRITNAVFDYVIANYPGFGTGRTILAGSSAGAYGVQIHLDNLKQRMLANGRTGELLGIADAAWFPEVAPLSQGKESTSWTMWNGAGEPNGATPQVNENCAAHLASGDAMSKCHTYAKYIVPWIEGGRLFERRTQFDHKASPADPSECQPGGDGGAAADLWARTMAGEMVQATTSVVHGQVLSPTAVGLTAVYSPGIVKGTGWCSARAEGDTAQDAMWTAHTTFIHTTDFFNDVLRCDATTPDYSLRDALNDFLSGKAVRKVRGSTTSALQRRRAARH
jgi:hypothetical protein